MSLNGQRIRFEPLRSIAFGALSGAYVAIGGPFTHAARIIRVDNFTDANLIISFDGTTDHTVSAATSGTVLDFASNRVGNVDQLEQPIGTTVYVKEEAAAATQGHVYVSVIYASSR